jgi:hypothetical protein
MHAISGVSSVRGTEIWCGPLLSGITALVIPVDAAQSYCPQFVHQISNGTTVIGPDH